MPNIASVLKLEISRVARKEVRSETETLKKAVTTHRGEIAALKRRLKEFEDHFRKQSKGADKARLEVGAPTASTASTETPFSSKVLATQRRRLQLSAEQLALLIGVSGQSIYNWEVGSAKPHAKYLPAISALKRLTAAQAAEISKSRRK